jgi:hypothetical protein
MEKDILTRKMQKKKKKKTMTLQFSVKYFGVKFKEKLLVFHVKNM